MRLLRRLFAQPTACGSPLLRRRQELQCRCTASKDAEVVEPRSSAPSAPGNPPPPERWNWLDSADAQRSHAILALILGVGTLPWAQEQSNAPLVYFVALAVTTIYIGSHKALTTDLRQQISIKEGVLAPVAASVSLFGLYLLLKFFPDLSVQTFIDAYFFLLGSFALSSGATCLLQAVPGLAAQSIPLTLPDWMLVDAEGNPAGRSGVSPAQLVGVALGVATAAADAATHHTVFTLSNLVACMVASDLLQLVGLRSFRTAAVLLLGLLVYDVFWVFGSPAVVGDNVMLTVATSSAISAPTRLLFPRVSAATDIGAFPFSLLGLGDIVVPGLLAGLALRYDASRAVDLRPRADAAIGAIDDAIAALPPGADQMDAGDAAAAAADKAYDEVADADDARQTVAAAGAGGEALPQAPPTDAVLQQRRYFNAVMVAYGGGLVAAFAANAVTGMGQPALLYLCPMTLAAAAALAASRKELGRVWAFVDTSSVTPFKKGQSK
eukprot:jgi/Ulvmu1/9240/UM005_0340.1